MRAASIAIVGLLWGCGADTDAPPPLPAPVPTTSTQHMPMPVPRKPSPGTLKVLLDTAPMHAAKPTAEDGTRVGTKSGVDGDAPVVYVEGTERAGIRAGEVKLRPQLSSPAIERAAREQIYWHLRKCVGPDGKPPPPESIELSFNIRVDGTVNPALVEASTDLPDYQETAACVAREFAAHPFRGPAATRRMTARVMITWPSVD